MLPSSISVSVETSPLSHVSSGSLLMRSSTDSKAVARASLSARGPLAQSVTRLVADGGARQAFQSWANGPLSVAFRSDAQRNAWMSARSLPTPNGYYRSQVGMGW